MLREGSGRGNEEAVMLLYCLEEGGKGVTEGLQRLRQECEGEEEGNEDVLRGGRSEGNGEAVVLLYCLEEGEKV